MPIKPKDFDWAIVVQDYETVMQAIKSGFNVNTPIRGKRPIVESAQTAEDARMLRILWEAGANPTTPWLEEVFSNFADGFDDDSAIPGDESNIDPGNLVDLTYDFSVKKLEFTDCTLTLSGADSDIQLEIAPFLLDDEIVETSVFLEGVQLPKTTKSLSGKTHSFPQNPEDGYIDGSIYLRSAHHPVDATEITFGQYEKSTKQIDAKIKMAFNFSFEGAGLDDEQLVKKFRLKVNR